MKSSNKKGFTLVELLVVIAIIAIIAAVAVPVTIGQINKAKISTAAQEANEVRGIAVQAIQDLAIKGKLSPADLANAMNESYTSLEQCTDIYVTKDATKGIEVIVVTDTDAAKADASNQIKITIGTASESNVVGSKTTLPGTEISLYKYTASGSKYEAQAAPCLIRITWNTDKFVPGAATEIKIGNISTKKAPIQNA